MPVLSDLIDRHGVDILDHLDRQVEVPVLCGLQAQGDVLVVPVALIGSAKAMSPAVLLVPAGGVAVVRGEAGGNTHMLLADGPVTFDARAVSVRDLTLGVLTVPDGATAWLAHPEHAYSGIGAGTYVLRRQREQADVQRLVAD